MMKIPNYRIENVLHSGSNYTIYSALRLSDATRVLVKTPCDTRQDARSSARLAYEFDVGSTCRHKNIVTFIELIKTESRPFLILEFFFMILY